jgi:hypothetical protein
VKIAKAPAVLGLLALVATSRATAEAATSAQGSSDAWGGLLLVVGFVALAYGLVFVIKLASGSKTLGPDKVSSADLDDYARPVDDPSFRFPNNWPRKE